MIAALLLAPALVFGPLAYGAPPGKPNSQKKNLKKNQSKIPGKAEATKEQAAAKTRLRDAETALRQIEKEYAAARKKAAEKHLKASGVEAAQTKLKTAQATAATIRKAVTNRVRERTSYAEASDAARKAGVELRALNDRPKMSAELKAARRSELAAVIRVPVQLEQESLAAAPAYVEAAGELQAATAAEQAARQKYQRLLADDPGLKRIVGEHGAAKKKLTTASSELDRAARQLQAAIRAEAQAKREQQAKKSRPQKNKKKGKTSGKNNSKKKKK